MGEATRSVITSPRSVSCEAGVAGSFVYTVTVLVTRPLSRPVSRRTVTVPAPPTGTSCPETSPTVHPHEPLTFSIRNGASPAFSSRKACSTTVPRSTLPKSCVGAGTTSRGAPAAQAATASPSAAELSPRRYTPRDCPAPRTSRCNRRWWRRRWPSSASPSGLARCDGGGWGRRRVALLAVVDATVATRVPERERVAHGVGDVGVVRIADRHGRRRDDERERHEDVGGQRRELLAQALDRLWPHHGEHLDEGHVHGAAAGDGGAAGGDRWDQRAREHGRPAEAAAGGRKAVAHRHAEALEAARVGDRELQVDVIDQQRLDEQVVAQLQPAAARVAEGVVRVREGQRLLAEGIPEPGGEDAVGDRRAGVRDLARDLALGDRRPSLEPARRAKDQVVLEERRRGRRAQPEGDHRAQHRPCLHVPHDSPPRPSSHQRRLTISPGVSTTNRTRPIASTATNRIRPPVRFLSACMPSANASGAMSDGSAVGSPARVRTCSIRATVEASQHPSARETRAAATMPIATASPCRNCRYSVSASSAWPTVCPKLSTARPPRSSRSSAATTAALCRAQVATTRTSTSPFSASRSSRWASTSSNSVSSMITPYLITSASPATSSRRGSVRSTPTSATTNSGWWKTPIRFFPSAWFTPVLPPMPASTWASSVVGTCTSGSPRKSVPAAKPARSPTTPPPSATTGERRSIPASSRRS